MSELASAVAGTLADLGGVTDEAEPEVPNSPEDAAAPEAHETAPVFQYAFDPKLPEDLDDLLNQPDEPTAAQVATYADEDHEELARRLAVTERQLEWERSQRLTQGRKVWEAEAKKYFPLAAAQTIQADSRRGFMRAAKEQHQQNYELLRPQLEEIARIKADLEVTGLAEARARTADAYGRPTVTVGAPTPGTTAGDRLADSRARRDLRGGVRAIVENL